MQYAQIEYLERRFWKKTTQVCKRNSCFSKYFKAERTTLITADPAFFRWNGFRNCFFWIVHREAKQPHWEKIISIGNWRCACLPWFSCLTHLMSIYSTIFRSCSWSISNYQLGYHRIKLLVQFGIHNVFKGVAPLKFCRPRATNHPRHLPQEVVVFIFYHHWTRYMSRKVYLTELEGFWQACAEIKYNSNGVLPSLL